MRTFKNVPVDPDTRIISEEEIEIDSKSVLIQQWSSGGIIAESLIFHSDDVADLDDVVLFDLVRNNYMVRDDRYTVSRSDSGYSFVNINFYDYEDLIIE
jgi:hypothetical protein